MSSVCCAIPWKLGLTARFVKLQFCWLSSSKWYDLWNCLKINKIEFKMKNETLNWVFSLNVFDGWVDYMFWSNTASWMWRFLLQQQCKLWCKPESHFSMKELSVCLHMKISSLELCLYVINFICYLQLCSVHFACTFTYLPHLLFGIQMQLQDQIIAQNHVLLN